MVKKNLYCKYILKTEHVLFTAEFFNNWVTIETTCRPTIIGLDSVPLVVW